MRGAVLLNALPDPGVLGVLGVRGVPPPREDGVPFLLDGVPFLLDGVPPLLRPDGVVFLAGAASPKFDADSAEETMPGSEDDCSKPALDSSSP